MRQQVVREQHRLRVLEVRHPGCRRIDMPVGNVGERRLEFGDALDQQPDVRAQEQPQVGGHLVVATAASPQLAAERPKPFD